MNPLLALPLMTVMMPWVNCDGAMVCTPGCASAVKPMLVVDAPEPLTPTMVTISGPGVERTALTVMALNGTPSTAIDKLALDVVVPPEPVVPLGLPPDPAVAGVPLDGPVGLEPPQAASPSVSAHTANQKPATGHRRTALVFDHRVGGEQSRVSITSFCAGIERHRRAGIHEACTCGLDVVL
jgi:hypothetical protein